MLTTSDWNKRLLPYAKPSMHKSVLQLTTTLILFAFVMLAAHFIYGINHIMFLPLSLVGGLLIVKMFIIQHDCGHHSYFRNKWLCDNVGRLMSLFTLTPYGFWRKDHDKHHATSGNLDKRGFGDIDTMTVSEYKQAGWKKRLLYRLYRNPIILFGLAPSFQFLIRYRIPYSLGKRGKLKSLLGILMHDMSLVMFFGTLIIFFGWLSVTMVWMPALIVAATVGLWLFYVQHNFDNTYWENHANWSFVESSLQGCSYYRLPYVLHWITGNIGYHHIHHLSAKIPNYNLPKVFNEVSELQETRSLGLIESLGCTRLALWCEQRRKLVGFKEALNS